MNSKLALIAVVMVAAIMVFGAISPVMAAPNENASDRAKERAGDKGNDKIKAGKVSICH
jgi:flagellar biosynthesis/type III secretory pathway M-ring protein FliF/YscJ